MVEQEDTENNNAGKFEIRSLYKNVFARRSDHTDRKAMKAKDNKGNLRAVERSARTRTQLSVTIGCLRFEKAGIQTRINVIVQLSFP